MGFRVCSADQVALDGWATWQHELQLDHDGGNRPCGILHWGLQLRCDATELGQSFECGDDRIDVNHGFDERSGRQDPQRAGENGTDRGSCVSVAIGFLRFVPVSVELFDVACCDHDRCSHSFVDRVAEQGRQLQPRRFDDSP